MIQKLKALRRFMAEHQLDAYLVPSADEHLNEYLPEEKKRREWITGFTGSAGDFLLTSNEAWLFVDSRYYQQADQEVDLSQIHLSKLGLEGHPSLLEKLKALAKHSKPFRLGFDPKTLSLQQFEDFQRQFSRSPIDLIALSPNGVDILWKDSPPPVHAPIIALPEAITGEAMVCKLERVRTEMTQLGTSVLPVTKLDQIAWLFNLRGQDIPYNPVFIAYALITLKQAYLFTECSRIPKQVLMDLEPLVSVRPYEDYETVLRQLSTPEKKQPVSVLLDPKHTTYFSAQVVTQAGGDSLALDTPLQRMKAVKNPQEIAGMQRANLQASRAKIRALYWLDEQLKAKRSVSETDFQKTIEAFYAEEPGFQGLSFNTISGAGANSAIVHYGTPNPKQKLKTGNFFLIDSGVQYWGGTTDDTRTVIVGKPTALQKKRFTEVLKAHINCAMQRFPKGTEGTRLDGITRAPLWNAGLDYGHGTGHGVGAFLNVHEGPNGIHRLASEPLQPGMITSIEPGFYEPGWGGIRLENLYVVKVLPDTCLPDGRPMYGFESLTYIPFDKRLINKASLTKEQLTWLSHYHRTIYRKLHASLPPSEASWLKRACSI